MAIKRTSRGFKDISLSFLPHPVTNDLPILLNERAITRSVRNIVETIPTEKFFNSLLVLMYVIVYLKTLQTQQLLFLLTKLGLVS